jgi:hypothetical protein
MLLAERREQARPQEPTNGIAATLLHPSGTAQNEY